MSNENIFMAYIN